LTTGFDLLDEGLYEDIEGIEPHHWNKVNEVCLTLVHIDASQYMEACAREISALITEDPVYDYIAGRMHMFSADIDAGFDLSLKNLRNNFDAYVSYLEANDLGNTEIYPIMREAAVATPYHLPMVKYAGAVMLKDRYFMRHKGNLIENWSLFVFRVGCGIGSDADHAVLLMSVMSNFEWLPGTPTLYNAGLKRSQMSSCYLLDSPEDAINDIYDQYKKIANLSKFAGGVATSWTKVRARGSHIKGTGGESNGIVPWLKILDSSVLSVNQCFSPNTTVYTADGPKAISKVTTDDLIVTEHGSLRKVGEVFNYANNEPCVELDVKHSVEPTKVTEGHPVLAIRGVKVGMSRKLTLKKLEEGKLAPEWVPVGELVKGDYVAQAVPSDVFPTPEVFGLHDAYMYGLMLGDGHCSKKTREWGISLGDAKAEVKAFVKRYLQQRGIHYWVGGKPGCEKIGWSYGDGVKSGADGRFIKGSSVNCLPFDREDLYDTDGNKRISRWLAHLEPTLTAQIIKGLVDTDGMVNRGKEIYFYTSSKPLMEGFRYLALRMGVPTAGNVKVTKPHTGTRIDGTQIEFRGGSTGYTVRLPAVPMFADLFGIQPIKRLNWLDFAGCVWSRVKSVKRIEPLPEVYDLKIEGPESYMTSNVLAHNGGRRKGACCVYIEPWHADIEEFLEVKDNTGDEARRTHNINTANWIPDLFMERVKVDAEWTLFDPAKVPELHDCFGETFRTAYESAEIAGMGVKTVRARDLYARMMRTLAETGNGWMTFKDRANENCSQVTKLNGNVVHSSNLCTEILEVTDSDNTAVCNLGSLNAEKFIKEGGELNVNRLIRTVAIVVEAMDNVVDRNFYPTEQARRSNMNWRPIGLGLMGLNDAFYKAKVGFDTPEACELSTTLQKTIYGTAWEISKYLAVTRGPFPKHTESRYAEGWNHPDGYLGVEHSSAPVELRNSLLIAIAPTASIATLAGCYPSIDANTSNLYKRSNLSGEFIVVNHWLANELKPLGLWTSRIRGAVIEGNGSVQHITEIPESIRNRYKTAWEISNKASIDLAAARQPYIDQSQSLNLFVESPTLDTLSSMYMYAWESGLKTTYYLRSRGATDIRKVETKTTFTDEEKLMCSLENPEACEACQ